MFEHAAPAPHSGQSGLEAPTVFALLVAPPRLDQASETAPAGAGRMRYYRVRSLVGYRVPIGEPPELDALETTVGASRVDVQRCHCG